MAAALIGGLSILPSPALEWDQVGTKSFLLLRAKYMEKTGHIRCTPYCYSDVADEGKGTFGRSPK